MGKYPPFGRLLLFNHGRHDLAAVTKRVWVGMGQIMPGLMDDKIGAFGVHQVIGNVLPIADHHSIKP